MRFLLAFALLACLAGTAPAWASSGSGKVEKPAEQGHVEGEAERTLGTPGEPAIDMPTLVAPMVVGGELQSYVYLSIRLKLNDVGQRSMMLEKVPYLQDAFLREVHGPSIAHNDDPSIVDEVALLARLMRVCEAVVGAGVVKEVEFKKAAPSTN